MSEVFDIGTNLVYVMMKGYRSIAEIDATTDRIRDEIDVGAEMYGFVVN